MFAGAGSLTRLHGGTNGCAQGQTRTMFERFTPDARKAIVLASAEARQLHHGEIGPEHVLLGLLGNPECTAAVVLADLDVTWDAARSLVAAAGGYGPPAADRHIPFAPQSKRALELAMRNALQLGDNFISTEHLLLGILATEPGVAHDVLTRLGGGPAAAREAILAHIAGSSRVAQRVRYGLELGMEPSERPEWQRPPSGLLPAVVPLSVIIGRSPTVVMVLSELRAYPAGAELTVLFRSRSVRGAEFGEQVIRRDRADDGLIVGVHFADGQHASTDDQPGRGAELEPDRVVLIAGGGFGSGESWHQEYWLRPLPASGDLTVECEWVEVGILRTDVTIDGDAIRAAARHATPLWE